MNSWDEAHYCLNEENLKVLQDGIWVGLPYVLNSGSKPKSYLLHVKKNSSCHFFCYSTVISIEKSCTAGPHNHLCLPPPSTTYSAINHLLLQHLLSLPPPTPSPSSVAVHHCRSSPQIIIIHRSLPPTAVLTTIYRS